MFRGGIQEDSEPEDLLDLDECEINDAAPEAAAEKVSRGCQGRDFLKESDLDAALKAAAKRFPASTPRKARLAILLRSFTAPKRVQEKFQSRTKVLDQMSEPLRCRKSGRSSEWGGRTCLNAQQQSSLCCVQLRLGHLILGRKPENHEKLYSNPLAV